MTFFTLSLYVVVNMWQYFTFWHHRDSVQTEEAMTFTMVSRQLRALTGIANDSSRFVLKPSMKPHFFFFTSSEVGLCELKLIYRCSLELTFVII